MIAVPNGAVEEPKRVTGADLIAARAQLAAIEPARFLADIERHVDADPLRGPGEPESPR